MSSSVCLSVINEIAGKLGLIKKFHFSANPTDPFLVLTYLPIYLLSVLSGNGYLRQNAAISGKGLRHFNKQHFLLNAVDIFLE